MKGSEQLQILTMIVLLTPANYTMQDREGMKVHTKFVKALHGAEEKMEVRNNDPTKHKYSLLMPSNPLVEPSMDAKPVGR